MDGWNLKGKSKMDEIVLLATSFCCPITFLQPLLCTGLGSSSAASTDESKTLSIIILMKKYWSTLFINLCDRLREETAAKFVAELRSLILQIWWDAPRHAQRSYIVHVCGVRDELAHVQWWLLAESNLTFQKAIDIAQLLERAIENAATLQTRTIISQ